MPQTASLLDSFARNYDSYRLQNASGSTQCVTVTLDAQTCVGTQFLQSAAYTPSFVPASPTTNYLADIGGSPDPVKGYSFNVTAGAPFDVTVNEINANALCPAYTLTVDGPSIAKLETHTDAGSLTASDPDQTGGIGSNDPESTCAVPQTASLFDSRPRNYDAYRFQNPTAIIQCVTVTLDAQTCVGTQFLQSAAYSPSFDPTNPTTNFLADIGANPNPVKSYSFNVNAGAPFDVTVNETNTGALCPAYTLTVSGFGIARGTPTAAALLALNATRAKESVRVSWRTGAETDTLGYHVYREQGAKRIRLSGKLIPAATKAGIHVYSWLDRKAPKGAARYWLQRVSVSGAKTWHGPATVASS